MARLTKPELVAALRAQVAGMTGDAAQIATALNAPEVLGHETGTVTPAEAYAAISASTLLALDEAAGANGSLAGEAIWLLSAIADVDPLDLGEGSRGADTLAALVAGGLVPVAERDALIAAARREVLGPSWGQRVGIGEVAVEFVLDMQEVRD